MSVRRLIVACAVFYFLLIGIPAQGQDRPQDYHGALRAACRNEIKAKCAGIPDRHGLLLTCLYGQEANLSSRCDGAVWGVIAALDTRLRNNDRVQHACDRDERQWCHEVTPAGGHFVACLLRAKQVVSLECRGTVYGIWDK